MKSLKGSSNETVKYLVSNSLTKTKISQEVQSKCETSVRKINKQLIDRDRHLPLVIYL